MRTPQNVAEIRKNVEAALEFVDGLVICEKCCLFYHPKLGAHLCGTNILPYQQELSEAKARLEKQIKRILLK